jgi:hypothetical protein
LQSSHVELFVAATKESPTVASLDHFRHELRSQLGKATIRGTADVVISTGDLCVAVVRHPSPQDRIYCNDVMRSEMKQPGDAILVESEDVGLTVHYRLPRSL